MVSVNVEHHVYLLTNSQYSFLRNVFYKFISYFCFCFERIIGSITSFF